MLEWHKAGSPFDRRPIPLTGNCGISKLIRNVPVVRSRRALTLF